MKQFSSGRKNHGKLNPVLEQLQNVLYSISFLLELKVN